MRRLIAPLVCLALLAAAGCGEPTIGNPESPGTQRGVDGGTGDVKPECPLTGAQVSDSVGQPMTDEGNCLFGDGNGVASLTVTTASQTAGAVTFDYQRTQAEQLYQRVTDIDKGDRVYLAVKDIGAEAAVVSDAGSFT